MKRLKLIIFITLFLFTAGTPLLCFAESVIYIGDSVHVESSTYEKAYSNSIDREVLTSETRYLASGIREISEIAIESGEKQHLDYTVEVDLDNDNVEFMLGYVPSNDTIGGNRLATVSEQIEYAEKNTGKNVVAALNGSYYEMDTAENNGLMINDGKVLSEARFLRNPSWHLYENFFAVTNDGEAVIVDALNRCYDRKTDTYKPVKDGEYQFAVSGDAIILKYGNIADEACVFATYNPEDARGQDHPRTAIGIREDGSVILFTTYTRIAPFNYGYTNKDVALIMQEKGCHTALMLDGGGSSTFISQHPGEKNDVLRNHISRITQRSVSCGVLVVAENVTEDKTTILSICDKKGHNYQYKSKTVTCTKCGYKSGTADFTGLVKDTDKGRYRMFIDGKLKTGWTPYGTEQVYYFNQQGLSCKTAIKEDVATTCTKKGYKVVTCSSAPAAEREYKLNYEDAPGHDCDKNGVCANCGKKQVEVGKCNVTLSYKKTAHTGSKRTPVVTLAAPDGRKLTKNNGDFKVTASNNIDIGTAKLVVEPIEYSNNYMENRGSITGVRTIKYQIVPQPAENLKATRTGYNSVDLRWAASKTAGKGYKITYDVYKKTSGVWKKIGSTQKVTYTVNGLKKATSYNFRVCATAKGSDGKKYEAGTFAAKQIKTKGLVAPAIKASNVIKTGKIKLAWKKIQGADKYKIYRAKTKNGKYYLMKTVSGTSYINRTAVKGKTYWYKVKAIDADNSSNNSAFSNKVMRKCR